MARQIFSLLLIVSLLVASSSAQSCLGTPAVAGLLSAGTACDGSIPCAKGYACDLTSTCSQVKVGDACVSDGGTGCPFQSSCVGAAGSQKCVANANAGGACSMQATNGAALCTSGGCTAVTNGVCIGQLGDGCSTGTDCGSGVCASGVCKNGCGTGSCNYNQVCDGATTTCVALPTSGNCYLGSFCAPGSSCVATDLTGTTLHCVKEFSSTSGSFCNTGKECASGLCWRNKCQTNSPDLCTWPPLSSGSPMTGCSVGNVCSCSNGYLTNGYGTCTSDKCWTSFWDLKSCLDQNCQSNLFDAPNNCVFKACHSQYQAYDSCDAGHALWTLYVLY